MVRLRIAGLKEKGGDPVLHWPLRRRRALLGSSTGPFGPDYRRLDIEGFKLESAASDDLRHARDVRVVAEREGAHQVSAIAVTYRDGFLRKRTATLPSPLCVLAFAGWTTIPIVSDRDCPLPE